MTDLKIARRLEDIKKTTLFSGLKNEELFAMLNNGKIIDCNKDEFLFFAEEKIDKFYIVLDGLLKLVKADSNGDEAIIKLIESGMICDIFSDEFPLTCKAIKDTVILTFPLNYFKESLKQNNKLAHNLLLEMSLQNQALASQINSLKISDGKEKVGEFLLRKSLKNGKKTKDVDLEYSKQELASYLGIRLETFSRILHQLKTDGEISIQKRKISLSKDKSLCSYCNSEIAAKCMSHNSDFCAQD